MVSVAEIVKTWLPSRHRPGSKGWITANAVCCNHRGHNTDTRNRGNWLIDANQYVSYTCYNCGFRTRYTGDGLTDSFRKLLGWMHVPDDVINTLRLEQLRESLNGSIESVALPIINQPVIHIPVPLPAGSQPISLLHEQGENNPNFIRVREYLLSRGRAVSNNYEYYWAPSGKWDMSHRLIIPFYNQNNIQIGYSSRFAGPTPDGKPKYVTSSLPPDYLFNSAALFKPNRRWVLVMEGPLDGISVDGVAALGHVLSTPQIELLQRSDKEIIIVPDRERKNQELIDQAIAHGWFVSFPEWESECKDVAQATKNYGELYTIHSIINSRTDSELQISVRRRRLGIA